MYGSSGGGKWRSLSDSRYRFKPHTASWSLENIEAMYEGTPEFIVDQGLYYPTATSYGYYCTGLEVPNNWEDPNRMIGADAVDIQYMGAQTEGLPCVYYTPSYGYAQSPYNPYNPYIPGAMMGIDESAVGGPQFYSIPAYEPPPSASYVPFAVQSNAMSNGSYDPWPESSMPQSSKSDRRVLKHTSQSVNIPKNMNKNGFDQRNSWKKVSDIPDINIRPGKQQVAQGGLTSGSASSHMLQGRTKVVSTQAIDKGKPIIHHGEMKASDPASAAWGADTFGDQNRGPRTKRSNSQLSVKAYTTKAGIPDAQGNIMIYTNNYNKEDFPVDYTNAKFFVIKSYSEDDVHKSIKYNVWSSTTHGNKKLGAAYDNAQKLAAGNSRDCRIFLFFSVNASGQFCGVAEMTGLVDFEKDMDFWQQDKWSGCFPVKWHFIKDVPNIYFRHIILENNESKPVTHSRDTQEIMFNQGIEMLKIFKNAPFKTSIFDDFMYYENRQKIMLEEKAKLLAKSFVNPFITPAIEPCKFNTAFDLSSSGNGCSTKNSDQVKSSGTVGSVTLLSSNINADNLIRESTEELALKSKDDISSMLNFGSLTINPREDSIESLATIPLGNREPADPVVVNNPAESSGSQTIGKISLDINASRLEKGDAAAADAGS